MSGDSTPAELPAGLLEEYLTSARSQLALLVGLADRLAVGGDPEALEQLCRESHKIRGSAGSYGFWDASRLAAGMEETAKDWVAQPDDRELDRGSLAHWFVVRLAATLGVELPAPDPAARASRAAAPRVAAPGGSRVPGVPGVPEVILVEDDAALADLLEYGLRARGYRFASYRNGREALTALLQLQPGDAHPLLLLDVDLPGLDGYSIFEALRRDRPGLYRVVFTTVHGDESEQLRGLEAGAIDYLTKPISLRVALEKIRHWVGR